MLNLFLLSSNPSTNLPVKTVAPEVFIEKCIIAVNEINKALGGIIIPLVLIGITFSIICFIAGGIARSKELKKSGSLGLAVCGIGYLLYVATPLIVGLLQYIAKIFQ